jgi:hypothetical protein
LAIASLTVYPTARASAPYRFPEPTTRPEPRTIVESPNAATTPGQSETKPATKPATKPDEKSRSKSSSPSFDATAEKLRSSALASIPSTSRLTRDNPIGSQAGSLYDSRNARPATPEFFRFFGPRAAGVRYDARMIHAAQIAAERARTHSVRSCWRYVKEALVEANVVDTYPATALAKQAGDELLQKHGFKRVPIEDPFKAPIGSVLVYGGRGPGHVEIRTAGGFVSDFISPTPSKRPLLGVFVKPL